MGGNDNISSIDSGYSTNINDIRGKINECFKTLREGGYINQIEKTDKITDNYFYCDEFCRPITSNLISKDKIKYNMKDSGEGHVYKAKPMIEYDTKKYTRTINGYNHFCYNVASVLDPSIQPKFTKIEEFSLQTDRDNDTVKGFKNNFFLKPQQDSSEKQAAIDTFNHSIQKY